jgi:hypothetical protein
VPGNVERRKIKRSTKNRMTRNPFPPSAEGRGFCFAKSRKNIHESNPVCQAAIAGSAQQGQAFKGRLKVTAPWRVAQTLNRYAACFLMENSGEEGKEAGLLDSIPGYGMDCLVVLTIFSRHK